MARQTRGQRRARREAQEASKAGVAKRAQARQQQLRPGAQPVKQQTGRRESAPRGRFVRESWGELKKVDWPGRRQVLTGSLVVVIACAIVGAYLYVIDLGFKELVENVILRSG